MSYRELRIQEIVLLEKLSNKGFKLKKDTVWCPFSWKLLGSNQ